MAHESLPRDGNCATCGLAVRLHFNQRNKMVGCVGAATALVPVDRGTLFQLRIRKNHEARQAALQTIRMRPDGQWQARIGGPIRGRTMHEPTRTRIEQRVHEHYNEARPARQAIEARPARQAGEARPARLVIHQSPQ